MKIHAFTKLLVVTFCMIGIGSLYPQLSYAVYNGTITDNFDGASLNTRLWSMHCDPDNQWVQQGGELRITISAGGGECVQVESKFRLKGDFEVTVNYRLITWPPANGGRLGFEGPGFSGDDYAMCMIKRISHGADEQPNPGEEVFMGAFKEGSEWSTNDVLTFNTPDEHGTLKLTRSGNRMTGSFKKDGGDWQPIVFRDYSPAGLPEWYAVTLSVCGRPFTNAEIAFDNFRVDYDQVRFLSDPSPMTLLLLE